jgi:glutaredoxin
MTRLLPALRLAIPAIVMTVLAGCAQKVDVDELRAEIGEKPVVLLSTSTCGYCRQLRADLGDWGVEFKDLDVETNRSGRRAYHQVNGRGVPILVIRDQVLHGYSPERARAMLIAADLLPES